MNKLVSSVRSFLTRAISGAPGGRKLRVGVIGCGDCGTFTAGQFVAHGGYEITAAADVFHDKLDAFGEEFHVPAGNRFAGLDGYKAMLAADVVDAVYIVSPSWFHNEHAAAAIDAGKHVFMAKPIAVDVPGVRSFEETAKKAAEKNLTLLVDLQTRGDDLFIEGLKRANEGATGELIFGEGFHHLSCLAKGIAPGTLADIYKTDTDRNIARFHEAVLTGDASNPTVPIAIKTTFTALLRRPAIYRLVTRDESLKNERRMAIDVAFLTR